MIFDNREPPWFDREIKNLKNIKIKFTHTPDRKSNHNFQFYLRYIQDLISTCNHVFRRAIWDKLPECIFENFEVARAKQG